VRARRILFVISAMVVGHAVAHQPHRTGPAAAALRSRRIDAVLGSADRPPRRTAGSRHSPLIVPGPPTCDFSGHDPAASGASREAPALARPFGLGAGRLLTGDLQVAGIERQS
jgi:hypothetical protein